MRTFIACFVCLVAVNVSQAGGRTYTGNGVTFNHPDKWEAKSDKKGAVATITVQNDKGTQATVQVQPAGGDPAAARGVFEVTFKKVFEGKLVAGSDKKVKRKIAGAEREGTAMDFEVAPGVVIHFSFFAFPLGADQPIVVVVFQHAGFDAAAATPGFEAIASSLAAAKK